MRWLNGNQETILKLVYNTESIQGLTPFEKYLYFAQAGRIKTLNYPFREGKYGPHSKHLIRDVRDLCSLGFLDSNLQFFTKFSELRYIELFNVQNPEIENYFRAFNLSLNFTEEEEFVISQIQDFFQETLGSLDLIELGASLHFKGAKFDNKQNIVFKEVENWKPKKYLACEKQLMWSLLETSNFIPESEEENSKTSQREPSRLEKLLLLRALKRERLEEDSTFEKKSSLRWDYQLTRVNTELESSVAKTLVGFLNSLGGKLVIGVDDDGQILGLANDYQTLRKPNRDGFELRLNQIMEKYFSIVHRNLIQVTFTQIAHKDIVVLSVEKSPRPVFFHTKGKREFVIRTGNETKSLDVQISVEYISQHWNK